MILFVIWIGVMLGTLVPLTMAYPIPLVPLWVSTLCTGFVLAGGITAVLKYRRATYKHYAPWFYGGLGVVIVCLSLLWVSTHIHDRLSHRWPDTMAGKSVTVEGWLDDLPREAEYGIRFGFRVTSISQVLPSMPERLWITAYTGSGRTDQPKEHWQPRAGECWRLTVKLKPPHGLINPHTFNAESWMFSHGFDATGTRASRSSVERIQQCGTVFPDHALQKLQHVRQSIKDKLQRSLGNVEYSGVIVALVIGDQPAISETQWQRFNATGIGHLISISGFHITFLAGIFAWLVKKAVRWWPWCLDRAPDRIWASCAGVLVAIAYVLLAGGGVPAQRTAWMIGMTTLGWSLGRWAQAGTLFAWATLGVLMIDPFAPLSAGFWLSFGGVGALMFSGIGRFPEKQSVWREALHSQKVATLVLAPITLFLFGQLSLIGPLANAFAIPLISIIITPLALFGALLPGMDMALQVAHSLFAVLDHVLQWLMNNPLLPALWRSLQPGLWATVGATAGLMYLCGAKGLPLRRMIGILSILPLSIPPSVPVPWGTARITVLDVGQGLSVLIETQAHRLLYDAGPRPFRASPTSKADAGSRIILPFLRGEGIDALDTLLISHHDMDHRGGANTVLEHYPVRQLLTSVSDLTSFPSRTLQTHFALCEAGQRWVWEGVTFSVLFPTSEWRLNTERENDKSCVLRVETAAGSILLPGDAGRSVEDELVSQSAPALRSTILIAGHHGSRTSTSEAWLAAVQPRWTVFTAGYLNHYRHPHADSVSRVVEAGSGVLRSDTDGAIVFWLPAAGEVPLPIRWREKGRRPWSH